MNGSTLKAHKIIPELVPLHKIDGHHELSPESRFLVGPQYHEQIHFDTVGGCSKP